MDELGWIAGIVLLLIIVFVPGLIRDHNETQITVACIEAGGQYIDDECIKEN